MNRNQSKDPQYHLRQQFDRDIKPHLLQSNASTADVDKCRDLFFSLRTTDKKVLEKHYNCTNPLVVRLNVSENVRSAVWGIVLMAEIERDPRQLGEKIGDAQFTYPISGRTSNHIQHCLESLRAWSHNNDVTDGLEETLDSAIGFIKSIHRRLNFMFRNNRDTELGTRRQLGNESRKQQLIDMFAAVSAQHDLHIDSALVDEMFLLLLEIGDHPSSPFKYPNPVNDRPSMLKSCHLEIVLAVYKRLYPEKKFTRPKICDAIDASYGWRPEHSNSKRNYWDLAVYIVERTLNKEEVKV